jgi:hypothetical protein
MSGKDVDRAQALYQGPVEDFIGARGALVKELQAEGLTQEATRVKGLRKPSVSAWALDQLAERDPEGIRSLLDAGAEIRAAQQATLSSERHAERLREATASRRRIVDRLAAQVADVLVEAGHSATSHEGDIKTTLEAASVDPNAGDRLQTGTLDRPLTDAVGFGDLFGLRSVPEGSEPDSGADDGRKTASKTELGRLRRDRDAAARKAQQAREAASRLADQVGAMQARLEEILEKHAAAEARALEAELEAKRADDALRDS